MPTEQAALHRRRKPALVLAAVGVVLLCALGSTPLTVGLFATPWDKVAHISCFALLAGLLSRGLGQHQLAWSFLLALLVGGADELHQIQLPGRSADWMDFGADALGAAAGCALSALMPALWLQ